MKRKFFIFVAVLGTVLFITGIGCNSTAAQNSRLNKTQSVKEFVVIAKQFSFEPDVITVNKNDTVRLTIINQDVEHSFSLPAFNLNVNLPPGQTETVEFVANQTGTFTFSCWVYCGRGHSDMVGKLIVQ